MGDFVTLIQLLLNQPIWWVCLLAIAAFGMFAYKTYCEIQKTKAETRKAKVEAVIKEHELLKLEQEDALDTSKKEESEFSDFPKYEPVSNSEWRISLIMALLNLGILFHIGTTQPLTTMTVFAIAVNALTMMLVSVFPIVLMLLRTARYSTRVHSWLALRSLQHTARIQSLQSTVLDNSLKHLALFVDEILPKLLKEKSQPTRETD